MCAQKAWVWGALILISSVAFPARALAGGIPGDMNSDGDVDSSDYALFRGCLTDPQQPTSPGCQLAKFDGDADVDLRDIGGFQLRFTGSCDSATANNGCHCPDPVGNGTITYSNVGATTDGPNEPSCDFGFGEALVASDLWYCYTATCTGTAFFGLCGSDYDTKVAVYGGCGCPSAPALACSDDDCGSGVENIQSRVEVPVVAGQDYMVRVGAYLSAQGPGQLTIGCNVDACATGTGDCFVPSPTGQPGCGDAECCAATCGVDQFCCDVRWDSTCAGEAQGVCTGNFPACTPTAGPCGTSHAPGCNDNECCNKVCFADPYCCLTTWDAPCVDEAEGLCFLTCGSAGSCGSVHINPGCSDVACCEMVCSEDPICCSRTWDVFCVALASEVCLP